MGSTDWTRRVLWRGILLPVLVAAGLVLVAVALIEGPAVEDFLYAIF
jgi:hypothetical protein